MRGIRAIVCVIVLIVGGSVHAQTPPAPTEIPSAPPIQPTTELPSNLAIHVVQRGETVFHIAQTYGTTVDYLVEVNGLVNAGSILVGQRLLIPTVPIPDIPTTTHIVQPGETLGGIANRAGMDVATLMQINQLANPDQVYAGQELLIATSSASPQEAAPVAPTSTQDSVPTSTSPTTPAATAEASVASLAMADTGVPTIGNIYTVQAGETLFQIATRYGLTVNDLVTANSLGDPTLIYAGQALVIPTMGGVEEALELPAPVTALHVAPMLFVEGETGSVTLTTAAPATITGTFLNQELHIVSSADGLQHSVVLGIPIFTEADVYPMALTIQAGTTRASLTFNIRVLSGGYYSQNLTVSAELAPLLAPAPQEYELELLARITTPFHPDQYYSGSFGLPAAAPMNSVFGTRRSYNGGEISGYHTGADFASAAGSPVLAAASGKVVLADLLNLRGNAIAIDHGRGVYTVYCHLSEINVQLGQMVDVGEVIGAAGSTGRITGPHLHWEVWVNGIPVNPLQWLQQSFP
jgi:murein DD-endopeptidase MepM/ murein hydrolase activator NlpD